ncbi:DgyrCDS3036 [Dimorphilus gyrociliatus]|uniref:DgyrCDS3036 n=1 Tax=Dimorphilus gyrociliatus TaxID=2664684 RepID=A0A7I8VDW4_9ANNE|nr:DgyrCDS3036 [Dimorphilus gyrociliatus]
MGSSSMPASSLPTPPDGGWGWVVVFSSFLLHIIADGISYSFGIFLRPFIDTFDSGRAQTSMVQSLMIGSTLCAGPIASVLTNRYGCRAVTIGGSLLAATAFIISAWAPNLIFLYISLGVVSGIGLGLMYLPAIVSVTFYFEKKRSFATGLAVCGSGVGTFAIAPLTEVLLQEYGWRGAILLQAGLILNCCICGALFRPLEEEKIEEEEEVSKEIEPISAPAKEHINIKMTRKDAFYSASLENIPMYKSDPALYKASIASIPREDYEEPSKPCSEIKNMMDFTLFLNPFFVMFAVSNFFTSIGFYVPYAYLKDRAVLEGHSDAKATLLLSIVGVANTVGRVVFGFLSDRKFINRLMLYNTALFICGIATAFSTISSAYPFLVTYAVFFGVLVGVYVSLTSVVIVDLLGLDKLSDAFGLILLFQGVATVAGPPIAGSIYDKTKSYVGPFALTGAMIGVSGFMLYAVPFVRRYIDKKEGVNARDVMMGMRVSSDAKIDGNDEEQEKCV